MKKSFQYIKKFWKKLGPGLITGASDDDPSGIATYSQAGAGFGLSTLWTALCTFPLMASIQEMCARIGMVTSLGLTGNLKRHYPKTILYIMLAFSCPAIILNIAADIAGMGAVAHMLIPSIPSFYFSVFFTLTLLLMIIYLPYRLIASILKYLCLTLLVYLIVPLLTHVDIKAILKATFVPQIHLSRNYLLTLVAILGTTISPYLFFWQANIEVEEMNDHQHTIIVDKKILKEMKKEIDLGMLFSNMVMYFIILSAGTVLYNNGIHQIDTVDQAASALKPIAGQSAYFLFAMGVIGTGILAIPVLSGSLSYIFCETFGWAEGLNKKFHEAKPFYIIISLALIIGVAINYLGMNPVKALFYSAVLYGITAPVLIALILHISNNKSIMGSFTNNRRSNLLGWITLIVMTMAAFSVLFY